MRDSFWKKLSFVFVTITFSFPVIMTVIIFGESMRAFKEIGIGLFMLKAGWRPLSPKPAFSIMPILSGTLYVSLLALIPALIFGVGCSLFLIFYVDKKIKKSALSLIDISAGVPSVIFGFVGLLWIVKLFEKGFGMSSGECVLSASLLLSFMLFPFVISNCCESLEKIKEEYYNTALGLGVSKEYFIKNIALKGMGRSIASSAMMAYGRAIGETMAVMMVLGNSPVYPRLLGRTETVASLTALEMGSAEFGSLHFSAIYAANAVLLIIIVIFYLFALAIKKKEENNNEK